MKDESIKHSNKLIFSVTVISCLIVSFLAAFWVAQSNNGYDASLIFAAVFIKNLLLEKEKTKVETSPKANKAEIKEKK